MLTKSLHNPVSAVTPPKMGSTSTADLLAITLNLSIQRVLVLVKKYSDTNTIFMFISTMCYVLLMMQK
jgi:hypothetical protein